MISDIRKWYMRLLLALACGIPGLLMTVGYFANIFFNAEGFIFMPVELLMGLSWNIPKAYFWGVINIFILVLFIGPIALPRIFIWPALILNLFILVGSTDLLWHNYQRAMIFWENIETGYGKYGWITEQLIIIFFSVLFVALLLPAAINMIKYANWYGHLTESWKNR